MVADENKLINATAFDKTLCNMIRNICSNSGNSQVADGVCLALAQLRAAPAVDAVEVVHGRWEDEHGGKYANPRYRCSVCKERALYKFKRDLLDNWKEEQALTPNCPNCGAKMDGGNNK